MGKATREVNICSYIAVQQYFSFIKSHYSLIQQRQPAVCERLGGYWVNTWGKRAAQRNNNKTPGLSKAYQQARNLQMHFKNAYGKIDHTQYMCTADEVTSLHIAS